MHFHDYPTRLIKKGHPDYPPLLRHIAQPPAQIYVKGSMKSQASLSIVGTRRNSLYGKVQTQALIKHLSPLPLSMVSGMAYGIDQIAHIAALEYAMHTIAVLGCGFEKLSFQQQKIAIQILDGGGCLLSEYAPSIPAQKHHFPQRNRIIAGMSQATVVIEAPLHSGALITAQYAFEENRDLYALPGDIDREQAQGCIRLLQKNQATALLTPFDLLQSYPHLQALITVNGLNQSCATTPLLLDQDQALIYEKLSNKEPKGLDQLVVETQREPLYILTILSGLELDGLVAQNERGYLKETRS